MALTPFTGKLDTPTGLQPFDGALDGEPRGKLRALADTVGIPLAKGVIGVPEAVTGLLDIPTGGAVGKAVESAGVRFKDAKGALDEMLSPQQQAINQGLQDTKGFLPTVGYALQNPSTILSAAVESAPSMLGGAAIGRGALAAGSNVVGRGAGAVGPALPGVLTRTVGEKAAPLVAGAIGEGAVGAGSSAEQIRQQSPTGDLTAGQSALAAGSGALTGLIGGAGGAVARRMGLTDIDTALVQGGLGASKKGIAARVGGGMLSEGLLEELPQSAQEQVAQNLALGRPWAEGVPEAAAMGALVGGVMGGGANVFAGKPQAPAPIPDQSGAAPDQGATVAPLRPNTTPAPGTEQGQTPLSGQSTAAPAPGTPPPIQRDETGASVHPEDVAAQVAGAQPDAGPLTKAAGIAATPIPDGPPTATEQARLNESLQGPMQDTVKQEQQALSELEAADARVQEQRQKESEAQRRAMLDAILEDSDVRDPVSKFAAELKRAGYQGEFSLPTKEEMGRVKRRADVVAATESEQIAEGNAAELEALIPEKREKGATVAPKAKPLPADLRPAASAAKAMKDGGATQFFEVVKRVTRDQGLQGPALMQRRSELMRAFKAFVPAPEQQVKRDAQKPSSADRQNIAGDNAPARSSSTAPTNQARAEPGVSVANVPAAMPGKTVSGAATSAAPASPAQSQVSGSRQQLAPGKNQSSPNNAGPALGTPQSVPESPPSPTPTVLKTPIVAPKQPTATPNAPVDSTGTAPGAKGAKQPPIVRYNREAAEIEKRLPAVPEGHTRLWRGNRPNEIGNPSFTNSLPGIALPFRDAYKGPLTYVDVPTADLKAYEQTGAVAAGSEFRVTPEIASKAITVDPAAPATTPPQPVNAVVETPAAKSTKEGIFARFAGPLNNATSGGRATDDVASTVARLHKIIKTIDGTKLTNTPGRKMMPMDARMLIAAYQKAPPSLKPLAKEIAEHAIAQFPDAKLSLLTRQEQKAADDAAKIAANKEKMDARRAERSAAKPNPARVGRDGKSWSNLTGDEEQRFDAWRKKHNASAYLENGNIHLSAPDSGGRIYRTNDFTLGDALRYFWKNHVDEVQPAVAPTAKVSPAVAKADEPVEPKRGDRFTANGKEYEVWKSRLGLIEAHPVVKGKPVVNRETTERWAITPQARAAYPDARTDYNTEKPERPRTPRQQANDARLRRQAEANKKVWPDTDTLLEAVIKEGGILQSYRRDITGDTKGSNPKIPYVGSLFGARGLGVDVMAQRMGQSGYDYIPAEIMDSADGGVQWLKDKIVEGIAGIHTYSSHYDIDEAMRKAQDEAMAAAAGDLTGADVAAVIAEHPDASAAEVVAAFDADAALHDAEITDEGVIESIKERAAVQADNGDLTYAEAIYDAIAAHLRNNEVNQQAAQDESPAAEAKTEKRYEYGLTLRPVSFATVPKGFVEFGKNEKYPHGTVIYDKPLLRKDIEAFELEPLDPADPINIKKRNDALREQVYNLFAEHDIVTATSKRNPNSRIALTRDAHNNDQFRITRFDGDMPWGHDVYKDIDEAALAFSDYDIVTVPALELKGQTPAEVLAAENVKPDPAAEDKRLADAQVGGFTLDAPKGAVTQTAVNNPKAQTSLLDAANTEDAGAELTYNRRNRIRGGIKWSDIADKNLTLQVKETNKQNVYPRPDYEAMIAGGMEPVVAHIVKQAYDSLAAKPQVRGTPTPEDLQRYIGAVQHYMDGVLAWANNKAQVRDWLVRLSGRARTMMQASSGQQVSLSALAQQTEKSLIDVVYPNGWKESRADILMIGANKALSGLQPNTDEAVKAMKAIDQGWPAAQEAWQKQGYNVTPKSAVHFTPFDNIDTKGKPYTAMQHAIKGRSGYQVFKGETAEEAKAAANAYRDGLGDFILSKKNGDIVGSYPTEEAAQEAAREQTKRDGKTTVSDKGISVELARREGPARRMEGESVTSDQLKETFGFKGVNFGNWMKGDANQAERQLHLNHAYDSFLDLAELLDVPPKAVSLNGMLGVAIGAQGGGSAAAHFVPGVNEINLTRTSGAGSLAHEWGHALDHYFATQAGLAAKAEPFLTEHTSGLKAPDGIRQPIFGAFKSIVNAMNKTLESPAEMAARIEASRAQTTKRVDGWLAAIKRDFMAQQVDEAKFDALATRIKALDLGDGKIAVGNTAMSPAIDELRALYKTKTGRTYALDNIKGLQANVDHAVYAASDKAAQATHQPQEVSTQYARNALALDQGKGGKRYWSTNLEKFARAFDAYVSDKLEAKAAKNTYLSHAGRGGETVPTGVEREAINKAIDTLVAEVETKETDKGIALGNRQENQPGQPLDRHLYSMVNSGATAAELLHAIATQSKSKLNRAIAHLLIRAKINPTVIMGAIDPSYKFATGNDHGYSASYVPEKDLVTLHSFGKVETDLIHEFMHSATVAAIRRKGMASVQMQALFKHVEKFIADHPELQGQYGMERIEEFVSEAFSNPKFQAMLKGIPAKASGPVRSAWEWFANIVRSILGVHPSQSNAFLQALEIGGALVEENMAVRDGDIVSVAAMGNRASIERYWSARTWATEADAREQIKRNIRENNARYAGFFSPDSESDVDEIQFTRAAGGKVKIKQAPARPTTPNPFGQEEPEGDVPDVDWTRRDMYNDRDEASVMKAYGRGRGRVYRAWIAINALPEAKGEDITGGLLDDNSGARDELSFRGEPPPIKVIIGARGKVRLADGNHRLAWWRERGFDMVPAYVIDERAPPESFANRAQQLTDAFKRWFAGSKVVDKDGAPLVVYHGSPNADFATFDKALINKNDPDALVNGFWFTSNEDDADTSGKFPWGRPNAPAAKVRPFYLSIQNPASKSDVAQAYRSLRNKQSPHSQDDVRAELQRLGFDGYWHSRAPRISQEDRAGFEQHGKINLDKNRWLELDDATGSVDLFDERVGGHVTGYDNLDEFLASEGDVLVAFNPTQIKSATGNNGNYDPANPSILGNRAGPVSRAAFDSARTLFEDMTKSDRVLNRIISKFNTPYHIAQTNPDFKPVYDEAQDFNHDISRYAKSAADQAPDLLVTIEGFRDFKKSAASNADIQTVSSALYEGTFYGGGSPLEGRVWTDAELKTGTDAQTKLKVFEPLNDGQIKLYRQALAALGDSLTENSKSMLWRVARTRDLTLDREGSLDQMVGEAKDAADAEIEKLNTQRQDSAERIKERIAATTEGDLRLNSGHITDLEKREAREAAKHAEQVAELEAFKSAADDIFTKTQGLIDHGYFPAMRFGKYAVYAEQQNPDGSREQLDFSRFDTQMAANAYKRQIQAQFPQATVTSDVMNEDAYKLFQGLNLDALELFAEHMVDDQGNPVSKDPLMQQFFRVAASERSSLKRQIHRKGVAGYSTDIPRALAQFTVSQATATSRNYHAAPMLQKVQDIKGGDLQSYATRYVKYLQDPQEESGPIRSLLANYFILGSIASGAVNMTQPILMTAPFLSQHTSWTKAIAELGKAAKDIATGRKTLTPRELADYAKAVAAGTVSPQEIHQLRADTRTSMVGDSQVWQKMESIAASKGVALPGKLAMRKIAYLWGSIYSLTEQFNRGITFLAAHRIAVDKGMADPFTFATDAVDATQGVYAKTNRPVFTRGTVLAVAGTFKQFSVAYLELAKRLYVSDKKAFALMMLSLAAMAGTAGLPFSDDVSDLLDSIGQWMGFATNTKKSIRQWATKTLGEDMANVLQHGVSGIPGVPIDVSNRLGMHNVIPGSALFKTAEPNKARDLVELLGPAASVFQNIGTAVQGAATGDFGKTKYLLPLAIQNAIQSGDMLSSGMYRDRAGRKIMDVDTTDSLFKMIGFQPGNVASESRKINQNQQDKDLHRVIESSIVGRIAQSAVEKDPEMRMEAYADLQAWNAKNPELRIRVTPQQIQSRIRNMMETREQRTIRTTAPELRGQVAADLR